jgi:hypothetical protein
MGQKEHMGMGREEARERKGRLPVRVLYAKEGIWLGDPNSPQQLQSGVPHNQIHVL